MRRFIPSVFTGLRARLVLGFLVVTLLSLLLVFATLPRLLDRYFLDQAQQDLDRRTGQVGYFIFQQIYQYQNPAGEAPRPILEGSPSTAAPGLIDTLANSPSGVLAVAQQVAQSDVKVQVAANPDDPDSVAYELDVRVGD